MSLFLKPFFEELEKIRSKYKKKPTKIERSNCCNPCGCRIPIKCFDKGECLYGKNQ